MDGRLHVGDPNTPALLGRGEDSVADDGRPVAVLEARLVAGRGSIVQHRGEELEPLGGERVLPAEDVTRCPPALEERMFRLRHED